MLNTVSTLTGSPLYAVPPGSQVAEGTDPATFEGWPEAVKVRFVQANGTGTPPAVIVGPAGSARILATVDAAGAEVATDPLPAGFDDLPEDLDPGAFQSWSNDLQLFYVRSHLAPGEDSVTIGPDAGAIEARVGAAGEGVAVSGGPAPDTADAADFFSWPQDVQYAYYQTHRDGALRLDLTGGGGSGVPVALAYNGVTYTVLARAEQLAAVGVDAATLTTAPTRSGAPDPTTFAVWPRELQRDYVLSFAESNGQGGVAYPATAVLGGGAVVASIAAGGADVDVRAAPSGFAAALAASTLPSLETYLAWPEAAQVAFARAKLGTLYQSMKLVSGTATGLADPSSLVVARDAASPSGLALTPTLGAAPQAGDLGLLQMLSPVQLQTYLGRNGTGTPPAVVLGTSPNLFIVTASATAAPPAVTVQSLPAKAATAATKATQAPLVKDRAEAAKDVTQGDFLGWTREVQTYVFGRAALGTPPGLLLGSLSDGTLVTAYSGPSAAGYALEGVPTGFDVRPDRLDGATLAGWSPQAQAHYVAVHGTGTPPSLVIGRRENESLVTRGAGSPGAAYTVETYPSQEPDLVTSDTFRGWSPAVQAHYFAVNAKWVVDGLPKALVLSPTNASETALVTATDASATAFTVSDYAPGGPATLDGSLFSDWTPDAQQYYVKGHGGAPLLIGPSGSRWLVTASGPSGQYLNAETYPATAPADLDAATFNGWSPTVQDFYVTTNGAGTPRSLVIGKEASQWLVSRRVDGTSGLAVQALAVQTIQHTMNVLGSILVLPSTYDNGVGSTSAPATIATFLGWTPEVRAYYIAHHLDAATDASKPPQTTLASGIVILAPTGDPSGVTSLLPYNSLPGGYVGLTSGVNDGVAQKLFPVYDGVVNLLSPKPAGFTTAPASLSPAVFASWNSAFQLEYIHNNRASLLPATAATVTVNAAGTATALSTDAGARTVPVPQYLRIGASVTTETPVDVFAGGRKSPAGYGLTVYTAQNLQKQDIAKMSIVDQTALSGIPAFNTLATGLGLSTSTTSIGYLVSSALKRIDSPTGTLTGDDASFAPAALSVDGNMSADDKNVFKAEINNIGTMLSGSAIYSPSDVSQKITEIMTRFTRANAFAVGLPGSFTIVGVHGSEKEGTGNFTDRDVWSSSAQDALNFLSYYGISADELKNSINSSVTQGPKIQNDTTTNSQVLNIAVGNSSYIRYTTDKDGGKIAHVTSVDVAFTSHKQSYDTFMQQEKIMLQTQNNGLAVARTGSVVDASGNAISGKLDLPNLIYYFQLYTNLAGEAKVRADTEEINETNNLLKRYGVMQQIINATMAQFSASESTGTDQPKKGLAGTTDASQRLQWNAAEAMFSSNFTPYVADPIETMKGITRPRNYLSDSRNSNQWQQIGTQLSDTVTLLNQDSQLKMNDINSETKQKDRNYDLASSALSKMYDNLQKILAAS